MGDELVMRWESVVWNWLKCWHVWISINGATPKSSIYRWIFHSNPPSYWGTPIYGNPLVCQNGPDDEWVILSYSIIQFCGVAFSSIPYPNGNKTSIIIQVDASAEKNAGSRSLLGRACICLSLHVPKPPESKIGNISRLPIYLSKRLVRHWQLKPPDVDITRLLVFSAAKFCRLNHQQSL